MSLRTTRSVVWMALVCCVFVVAGCSKGTDGRASSASSVPTVAGSGSGMGSVLGSWVLRLGDRDKPEEFTLQLGIDGTAVATDSCNYMQTTWVPTADPSKITFAATTTTQRLCADRPDFIGLPTAARLDERDRLLVTASGREWTYVRP